MSNYFDLGSKLNSDLIEKILSKNQKLRLSLMAKEKIQKSRSFLEKSIKNGNKKIYGVNTGFGSLCDKEIPTDKINDLQENLILSHACGTGDIVPKEIAKLMLLLKIM